MNKLSIEWPIIRGALGVLSLCLLLSALLLGGTFHFRNAMKRDYKAHDSQFKAVSREYLNVDVDERIINDQYPKFIELYNKGGDRRGAKAQLGGNAGERQNVA